MNTENIKERFIDNCIKNNYKPYALTVTFLNSPDYQNYFPDSEYYSKQVDNRNFDVLDNYATKLEYKFRTILNKMSSFILNTRNITRPNNSSRLPYVFYTMERMNYWSRRRAIENVKGSINISPLHFHGLMLAHPVTISRTDEIRNPETFRFSLKKLSSIVQEYELKETSDSFGWNNYMNKDQDKFFAAYGGFYPKKFLETEKLILSNNENI